MFVIRYRKIFFLISVLFVLASIIILFTYGLRLGTDFTGGTILELDYIEGDRPTNEEAQNRLTPLGLGQVSVQFIGEHGLLLRLQPLSEIEKAGVLHALTFHEPPAERRYSSIGPVVGEELARKGIIAIIVVVVLIVLYIAFVFRHVSDPQLTYRGGVRSWKYGVIAILALVHDIIIPTGVMALLGYFYGAEADALFLTALLTILGLSVNDTIVVFDRIRENLKHSGGEKFDELVGRSLKATITRSLITSLTLILVLMAIFFFGGASTKYFALIMAIGMLVGTYSSIFLAAPLLVSWQKFSGRVK